MLPDFPSLKEEFAKNLDAALHRRVQMGDPVLAGIKHYTQHEGTELQYEQRGGGQVREGMEKFGVEFTITMDEVPGLVGDKLVAKLAGIAQEMTSKQAQHFFRVVGESCKQAGNEIDAGGKSVTPELLLEMFDRVETSFDEDGNPTSSFVVHPDMVPQLKKVAEQIENDPNLKRRNQEILDRQRREWAARESNRKLVD